MQYIRVKDWAHILGLTLLGYIYAAKGSIYFIPLAQGLFISALYLGYGYSLNQYFDTKLQDYKQVALIFPTSSPFTSYIIIIIAILIACFLHWQTALIVIFGASAGLVYSAPPVRAKGRHFWGLFCNAFCFTPLFLIGYSTVKSLDLKAMLMAVFIWLLFLPLDLVHQLNDYRQDKENNVSTFAVKFGIKKTIFMAVTTLAFTLLWALFLSSYLRMTLLFFFTTLLFLLCAALYLVSRFIKYGNDVNVYAIKLKLRYLFIAYGASLFIIFLAY